MDAFHIRLAGRWRTRARDPACTDPLELRDHVDLGLGEGSLTAHADEEVLLPFLAALLDALEALDRGGPAALPLPASGHVLSLGRTGDTCTFTLVTETGRPIVRDAHTPYAALRAHARAVIQDVLAALVEIRPAWRRRAPLPALRRRLLRTLPTDGPADVAPFAATAAGGPRALPRVRFPLQVGDACLRLGVQPARNEPSVGRKGTWLRLFDAALAVARDPARRATVAWSATPRTHLILERVAAGPAQWALRDSTTVWMSGQLPMNALVATLADTAAAIPELDAAEVRRRVQDLRRWLVAERTPSVVGPTRPPLLPPAAVPATGDAPAELAASALYRVAFRRQWRRPLRRFFLAPQSLGEHVVRVQTPEGLLGLARDTGQPVWRLAGAHPLLPAGQGELAIDSRGHLIGLARGVDPVAWRQRTPWRQTPAVVVAQDALGAVIGTEDGHIVGIDAAGATVFRSRLLAGAAVGVALGPELLWMTGEDRHVSAFRRDDGASLFRVPLDGHAAGGPIWCQAGLLVPVQRGARTHLLVFDAATGAPRLDLVLPGQLVSVQRLGGFDARLLCWTSTTEDGVATTAFDLATGRAVYALPPGAARSSLSWHRGVLYVGEPDGIVRAYDAADGAALWASEAEPGAEERVASTRPLAVRGLLYVVGASLRVLDPATGRCLARVPVDDLDVTTWLVSPEGDVLLADAERALVYLRLSGHLSRVE